MGSTSINPHLRFKWQGSIPAQKLLPNRRKSNIYLHDRGEGVSPLTISCALSEARKNVDTRNSSFGGIGCALCFCLHIRGIKVVNGEPGRR